MDLVVIISIAFSSFALGFSSGVALQKWAVKKDKEAAD